MSQEVNGLLLSVQHVCTLESPAHMSFGTRFRGAPPSNLFKIGCKVLGFRRIEHNVGRIDNSIGIGFRSVNRSIRSMNIFAVAPFRFLLQGMNIDFHWVGAGIFFRRNSPNALQIIGLPMLGCTFDCRIDPHGIRSKRPNAFGGCAIRTAAGFLLWRCGHVHHVVRGNSQILQRFGGIVLQRLSIKAQFLVLDRNIVFVRNPLFQIRHGILGRIHRYG
mmetsp:Transcript_3266/g.7624  ORF Transcript_3266/g.7624 Transcript_3266/m.7624 type:complete len:218 (+) Transcript_3266:73-726(+)